MVVGATALAPDEVRADVMGTSLYEVCIRLAEEARELGVFCSCPVGEKYGEPCKHLWAVLREIDARNLLPASRRVERLRVRLAPERARQGDVSADNTDDDELEGYDERVNEPRTQRPPAVLDALLQRRSSPLDAPFGPVLELFALLNVDEWSAEPVRLTLLTFTSGGYRTASRKELLTRAKPGTLDGDLALLALQYEQAPHFVSRFGSLGSLPSDVPLPWADTPRWLRRLADQGRLLRLDERNRVVVVRSGPDGVGLSLSVVVEPAEAAYRLVPSALVGEDELELGRLRRAHGSGIALLDGALVALRSPAEAEWLVTLQRYGTSELVLAADELEGFLERYYGESGLPAVRLPQGLELVTRELPPERFVDVAASDGSGQGVPLHVRLRYGEKEVPLLPARAWAVDLASGVRYRRDPRIEAALVAELEELGARRLPTAALGGGTSGEVFRIGSKRVHELALALLRRGWRVSVARKAYRRIDGFRLRAASGIDWLEISGTFELGGQELPLGELLRALQRRRRSDTVLELDAGVVATGAEALLSRFEWLLELGGSLDPSGASLRLSPAHAGAAVALLESATNAQQDTNFSKLRQALERGALPRSTTPPRGFRGTLRGYQREGLGWLRWLEEVGFGGCLADDMGLGKTVQVLALLLGRGRRHGPSLVVAPRSVLHNWASEAQRFAPALEPVVHWGPERTSSAEVLGSCRLVVTTYAVLARDIELLSAVAWDYVVVDEAQAIKNPSTRSAKLVRRLQSKHRVALTGTPIENHLDELWALLDFLNPGFGRQAPFKNRALSASDSALIRSLIRPFVLRRTKARVAPDLPERVEQTLEVELNRGERRRYDELARKLRRQYADAVAELGVQRSTPVLLTGLLRLRQAACHQGLLDERQRGQPSSKLAVLMDRLSELREEGAKSLVFSQFTEHLDLVELELTKAGISFVRLDGKTRRRAERVRAFQEDASVAVFLISLKAGGLGMNLTAAEYVFLLDPWWNPAAEAQAIDRAHRIGQSSRVVAYRLIAAGTVEEKVAALQRRKRELVDSVFGDERAFLGKLSHDDLAALLHE